MYVVNRAVIIIKPKEPYLTWANHVAQSYETLEELASLSKAVLIPHYAYDNVETFLKENFTPIFEMELESWVPENRYWPKNRDYETFKNWFEVEVYALVVDFADEELSRESYWKRL